MVEEKEEPCYVISVTAKIVGVHAQTLRYYEKAGLVQPSRSRGNIRLYSPKDVERLRLIRTLMDDMGVNLAGVEVILRLSEQIAQREKMIMEMESELKRLREAGL